MSPDEIVLALNRMSKGGIKVPFINKKLETFGQKLLQKIASMLSLKHEEINSLIHGFSKSSSEELGVESKIYLIYCTLR